MLKRAETRWRTHSARPAQLVLLATVARRHFLDGRSKVEIAEEFGVSRFKVARLIDAARERGIVHIEIRHVDGIDVDLSARLQERFQLQHARRRRHAPGRPGRRATAPGTGRR